MFKQKSMLTTVRIEAVADGFAIHSPYNPAFVAALKSRVPGSDRKWDADRKVWVVAHSQGQTAIDLIQSYYAQTVSLPTPQILRSTPISEMRLVEVRYLGAAKGRDDGSETAFAWTNGGWNAIFPKTVLLEWFGQTSRPDEAQTLYGVLGVTQEVAPDELKKAWKRLARTWHPDVSKEPGSREQFQAIQQAYEVLSNETTRAKYNAGLAFEAMSKAHTPDTYARAFERTQEWRAPLRCGLILCQGESRLGRFVVSQIMQWQDIVNSRGEVLVTSWAMGDDKFTESWVMP